MKPLDVIVNDINGGKINTWGKVMMYATMNGIDTNENNSDRIVQIHKS